MKILELSSESGFIWKVVNEQPALTPDQVNLLINGTDAEKAQMAAIASSRVRLTDSTQGEKDACDIKLNSLYSGDVNKIVAANFTVQADNTVSTGIINIGGTLDQTQIRF